ncbi:hypothetical protein L917_05649 [Phytophthora nicotianae]|uniref:RxLR effector protein n=1 Tax=Phytophthora nicotianae TaxID=4792 RepID=W2LK27_PHYNI|nr:hypothetical protein L917_05649 [Phytophthora nicotianae]
MRLVVIVLAIVATTIASGNALPSVQGKVHAAGLPESTNRLRTVEDNNSKNSDRGNSVNDRSIEGESGNSLGDDGLTEEERGLVSWYFLLGPLSKSRSKVEAAERLPRHRIIRPMLSKIKSSNEKLANANKAINKS